jgi:flagellar biosynthesis protein FlhF
MKIKSYYSATVEEAVSTARREMGPEAMLVSSRKTSTEYRHLGEYEVVFAGDLSTEDGAGFDEALPSSPPGERLSTEVAELRRELEAMRRTLTRAAFQRTDWLGASAGASEAYASLNLADIPAELAAEIVEATERRLQRAKVPGRFDQALADELASRIAVTPTLGCGDSTPRIVCLVGPPGSGKTTTLVKLAVNYGLACRRPAVLLSTDNYRVAAAEQLRSYAAILGIGFELTETVRALSQAIEESRNKDLVLIDTPGLGPADLESAGELARFLVTRGDIDTHLVLAATIKPAEMTRMVEKFAPFHPGRLLFTRIDETLTFGPIYAQAVRSSLPLSFFSNGQRIPEDLRAVTLDGLVEMLLAPAGIARTAA